jgi:hypothetical protein
VQLITDQQPGNSPAVLSLAIGDFNFVPIFPVLRDPAGVKLNLSTRPLVITELGNLRRSPMTVNFPVGPDMAHEPRFSASGSDCQIRDVTGRREVDYSLPANPLLLSFAH